MNRPGQHSTLDAESSAGATCGAEGSGGLSQMARGRKCNSAIPYQVHNATALKPYKRFPKLYGERKFQRPIDKPQTLSFLALPAEIRLQIYKLHLSFDEPIELWAESGKLHADERLRRVNAAILGGMFRNKEVNLGFLQTCKQINVEAAEIFYANEFRFSGVKGHMAAYAYLHKIWPRNVDFLKSLTIAAPAYSTDHGHYGENWIPGTWNRINQVYNRMPFPYPADTKYNRWRYARLGFGDAWCMLAWKLAAAQRLESLTLVLGNYPGHEPAHYTMWTSSLSAFEDLVAAKPFLEMHVVRMFGQVDDAYSLPKDQATIIRKLKTIGICRFHLALFEEKGRWSLEARLFVDKRGGFTQDEDEDRSVQDVDVLPDIWRLFKRSWNDL